MKCLWLRFLVRYRLCKRRGISRFYTLTATTATPSLLPCTKDFPDFLSPVVVKELRQALRSGGFVGLFCFIQVSLLTITLGQLLAGDDQLQRLDEMFWFACIIALIVFVPMRAFNSLSSEVHSDTFHLLQLTRMSSWRIVVGKCTATLALTVLVAVSMFPFFVFRYFRGGVAIVSEVTQLGLIVSAGAMVIAFTVAFSAHSAFLVRGLMFVCIAGGSALAAFSLVLDGEMMSYSSLAIVMLFAGALVLGGYALFMGAGWIATGDENYSAAKRLVAMSLLFAMTVVDLCLDWDANREMPLEGFQLLLAAVFLCDSVTEAPRYGRGIIKKTLEIPIIGRASLLRMLCYPGWQSGHLFFAPVAALMFAAQYRFDNTDPDSNPFFIVLFLAMMMFPTAIIQACHWRTVDRFLGRFVLIGVLMIAYGAILISLSGGFDYDVEVGAATFFAAIMTPFSAMLVGEREFTNSLFNADTPERSVFIVGACISMIWYLVLFLKGLLVSARIRAAEAVARGELAVSRGQAE